MSTPPPPAQLAEFEILRRLGAGGMAEVFLAKKRGAEGTYKLLVVKRVLPAHGSSRRFRTMFVEEAHLATRLNHPNIVQVYEFSDHGDDGLLLSMEFVDGYDLGKLVASARQKGSKVPPYVAAFIVAEAAKGLHYAHERKDEGGQPLAIVHRDVSPQNILLSHEGIVKIADFGIASASLFRDEPGVLKGKFGYMSPEQARGQKADRRSDIYALGVVLYELLALRSPYGKLDDGALLDAVRAGVVTPPSAHVPSVPPELEVVAMRALARDPAARYQTARDMAGALARAILATQELVDAATVEATLASLLGRDPQLPPLFDASAGSFVQPQTMAAIPAPRTDGGSPQNGTGVPPAPRAVREVRHVAMVTLRVEGVAELDAALGRAASRKTLAAVERTLEAIAYKRGAVWAWEGAESARTVVGLLANPSRAAADAASLAIDVHEALAGASEDMPVVLRAAIGIVRGIASGERDERGHLGNHALQEPAHVLADHLAEKTPFGKTWVAGGVYRLVRRDFRWGDAPTLELGETATLYQVPPQMRLYALLRPLTREERVAEIALAPNDLVGRDAEKADLFAAYHRSVTPVLEISPGPSSAIAGAIASASVSTLTLGPPRALGPALLAALSANLPPAESTRGAPPRAPTPSRPPPSPAPPRSSGSAMPPSARPLSAQRPSARASAPPSSVVDDARARRSRGQLIARVITGEMGIGKTALVATFLAELPSSARVLHVECSPVKSELPLATVADLLRDITGMGIDHGFDEVESLLRALLGPSGRALQGGRIVTRLAELVTGKQREHADEDAANYRRDLVLTGVRLLLGVLARTQPLVIVIDGLQWGDRPSLDVLQELLKRQDPLPILVLLVTRADERVTSFLEGLVRIELRGLSAEEQVRLVEARLGVRDGVAAICAELVPRVAGNPFFLLEMVDALLERGTLEIVEKRSVDAGDAGDDDGGEPEHELVRHDRGERAEALPSTLEQLIGDRLRELPGAEHDVVDWLAVAGGPLLEADILSLTRLAHDEPITRLCARGLCDRRAGSLDFRHPLVRDVAYLALDSPSRSRMHRLLGEHLATTPLAQGLSAAIVARHLARGEAPGPAAELYLEAAGAARNAHQAQLATRYYQRALELLPPSDGRRVQAHDALEGIYRHLGRRRERRKHLDALRELALTTGQARWAALALVRTARLDHDERHFARGKPIAERAAEVARIAKQPALEVEACVILSEIARDLGDVQGAIEACERAIAVADGARLPARMRAEVMRTKGVLLRYVGRVTEAVECYADALAVFKAVGARRSEARAKNALAFAMFVLERFEDAIALALSAVSIDLSLGGRFQIAKTLSNVGQAYARLGDLDRGLLYLRRARDAHERYADQDSRADTLLCYAEALLEKGDVDAAHTLCGDAGALVAVTGSVYDTVHERIIRAMLCRAQHDHKPAATLAAEARRLAEGQGLMSYHALATAIEGASRASAGELHTGLLLSRTALGAIEAAGASEYGVEVRALAVEALRRGSRAGAREASQRASAHVRKVAGFIRDPRLRATFFARPPVRRILDVAADTEARAPVEIALAGASSGAGVPDSTRAPLPPESSAVALPPAPFPATAFEVDRETAENMPKPVTNDDALELPLPAEERS